MIHLIRTESFAFFLYLLNNFTSSALILKMLFYSLPTQAVTDFEKTRLNAINF